MGYRFNAATTRRPWRVEDSLVFTLDMECFNAATTRRPWRAEWILGNDLLFLRASMRPRPGGRGEVRQIVALRADRAALQCGHDPEAVERPRDPGAEMR